MHDLHSAKLEITHILAHMLAVNSPLVEAFKWMQFGKQTAKEDEKLVAF